MTAILKLVFTIAACGMLMLAVANFVDRAHRHEGRNGRIALEER